METKTKKLTGKVLSTFAVLAVLGLAAWGIWEGSAYYVGTVIPRGFYLAAPILVAILAPLVAAIALGTFSYLSSEYHASAYRSWGDPEPRRSRTQIVLSRAALVGLVLTVVWFAQGTRWMNRYGFETKAPYAANLVEVADASTPGYEPRLSVPQARLQLRQALSGTAGRLGDVTYIGNKETPEYCAPVWRNATMGRVWTREILCLDPATGATRTAAFTGNVGSPEGVWSSKLGDQVAETKRGAVYTPADAYGYITDEGAARLVVPVRVATGEWNRRYDVAGGVVVFEADGTRKYLSEVSPGEIPGPVMPMSIAENVRGAVNTREGFIKHRNPRRSAASLEGTNMAENTGATDPNAENPSEFVLVRNGRLYYVTPLTPYGQSQTVVAYLEVAADTVKAGEMPEAKLYRLGIPQASLQLIVQRVTSLYDADIEWMEANEATDASNKARIYEITPGKPGEVTLTIGTGTQTLYRVYVEAGLDEQNKFGTICIHRARNDEKIRCDGADADPAPVGALRGIAGGGESSGSETPSGVDLTTVPTQELLDEIARRIAN